MLICTKTITLSTRNHTSYPIQATEAITVTANAFENFLYISNLAELLFAWKEIILVSKSYAVSKHNNITRE